MGRDFDIRKEVVLAATPEQVWAAIATEAGLAAWFMPMPVDADSDGVKAWEPAQRLRIQMPPAADGSFDAFDYVIEGRGDGTTVLRFVHSGFLGDGWSDEYEPMTAGGWDMYLCTLAQYFRWFAGRSAVYVEASGPPSSMAPGAWAGLVVALGVGPDPAVDAPVRVSLPGGTVVDGVVDYVAPTFVGLRTTNSLIRFHGRGAIGLPVAVSHHCYDGGLDAAATTAAWTAWLVDVFAGVVRSASQSREAGANPARSSPL